MRKIKYQNWIYEILTETSPQPFPIGLHHPEQSRGTGEGIETQVSKALARLSEKEKIFIEEFYYQGRSYKEISQLLKINLKQAEYLHKKATLKLKNLLAGFVEKRFKLKADKTPLRNSADSHKSISTCLICCNPKQKEIERVIAGKKEYQTWGVILKKLSAKFNLNVKAPQVLIGHMKHRS